MLRKLLKYDLKWCYRPLIVFYILAIFFAIVTRIIESFEMSFIILILDKICSSILIAIIISLLINTFMRVWVRVIKNLYKDEAYLTHTLPVSKSNIYLSKVLTAVITLLTALLVIVICISICFLHGNTIDVIKMELNTAATYFNTSVFNLVIIFAIILLAEFLFVVMCGIVGSIIGYKANNYKIIKTIVIGFCIYSFLSLVSLGTLYVLGFINPEISNLFRNVEITASAVKFTLYVGMIQYIIYNVVLYFVGSKVLAKGIDID